MAAASSSSSGGSWEYDVFINFRGEDTRRGFVCHLYKDLKRKAFDTFIDSEELRKGDDLSELLKAIQGSRLSLLVFSENYASSTWCLKELVQILKCMDTQNQIVVPIFYQVDPSDVRKFKGSFGEALAKHERDSAADMEEMESWKSSLIRATNLSGWDSKNYQDDAKLMEDIVEDIFNKLSHISAIRDDGLVGMNSHINEMEKLLCPGMADVRFIGIWGMGGLGKTTIATAVYNKIDGQFEHCCFLENIKERFRAPNGVIHTQEELLSRMLKEKRQILGTLDKGLNMIREKLGKKKVLLVLDDVDKLDQIEDLLGKKPSFGGGSRIIITTRDRHLLAGYAIYEPKSFTDDKALELFSQYAFRTNPPSRNYNDLSRRAIEYADGLPLALKVLGGLLDNKSVPEWKDELEKIKKIPNRGIQGVLRTSFDGLDDSQKNIFLDIACFFRGYEKEYVTELLDSFGFFPHSGLRVLEDRALVTVTYKLEMHDLIQEMGWDIVNGDPRGPSRLWRYEDVDRVLSQNTDTGVVEGIILDISELEKVSINTEAFDSMKKLRMLQLEDSNCRWDDDGWDDDEWDDDEWDTCEQHTSGDLKSLSSELRFLVWHRCPLMSLPSSFDPKKLVKLDMHYSHIKQLWEGTKHLQKLAVINLSGSQYLNKIPDLTEATNLKTLNLRRCVSLVEVHPSISALKNLVYLDLRGCKELKIFPSFIDMKSLKRLDLSGCSNLEKFCLEFSEDMKELKLLLLDETAITEITSSINNHPGLHTLGLRGCRELRSLPSSIHLKSLQNELDLSGCSNLEEFPEISGDMNELSNLNLNETAIKELPSSIEFLKQLVRLTMSDCRSLVCLPDNICKLACLKQLYLDGCSKLSNLPENLGDLEHLSELFLGGSGIQQLPFSISRWSKLETLSCSGCKEMTAPFSSWPTWIQENPSYSVLVHLDLSDCNLLDLSDGIAHLSSLITLRLCRNKKLESLPAAMNRLVRLTYLRLDGCKRLKSIPELSSSIEFMDADDCTALKTVSTPKPPYFKEYSNRFLFYNCFQLVQTNLFTDIVETAADNQAYYRCFRLLQTNLFTDIVETAADNQAYYHPVSLFVSLPAGSDIPDWFNHRCRGSSVTVQLPPNWFPCKFVGLAICAISNLRGADNSKTLRSAVCRCTFKANDGDEESFHFPLADYMFRGYMFLGYSCSTNKLLESDHMFLRYENSSSLGEWHNKGKYTEARFRIVTGDNGVIPNDSMTLEDCTWITSCGVRLFDFNNDFSFSKDLCDLESSNRKRVTVKKKKERERVPPLQNKSTASCVYDFSKVAEALAIIVKKKKERERVPPLQNDSMSLQNKSTASCVYDFSKVAEALAIMDKEALDALPFSRRRKDFSKSIKKNRDDEKAAADDLTLDQRLVRKEKLLKNHEEQRR